MQAESVLARRMAYFWPHYPLESNQVQLRLLLITDDGKTNSIKQSISEVKIFDNTGTLRKHKKKIKPNKQVLIWQTLNPAYI